MMASLPPLNTLTRGAGPNTVLFLHGFMGAARDWARMMEALGEGYRCLAVDLPGHGASVGLPEAAYTMEGAARMIADALDDADIARCAVVGYSMGGRLALYFALHFPERCTQLLLESASPGLATEAERTARRAVDEGRAVQILDDFEGFLEDWYRMPLFASLARHEGLIESMQKARSRNAPVELTRSLRGMGTGRQPSLWSRLPALSMPTLVMAGALDGKFAEIAHLMAAHTQRIHAALISDAGHIVHAERPTAYLSTLRTFLQHTAT